MDQYLRALRQIKDELGDTICLCGQIAAPFTSCSLIFGVSDTLTLIFEDQELLKKTSEFFVDLQIEWGKAQLNAGADALWLGDCVASSSFISPQQYREFASQGASKVSEALQKEGGYIFYHTGDKSLTHLQLAAYLGFSALNIGEGIDMAKVIEFIRLREPCVLVAPPISRSNSLLPCTQPSLRQTMRSAGF